MDPKLYYKHYQEYSEKFRLAYLAFMKAISLATDKYSPKLPAYSNEYEAAISRASAEYIKTLSDLKGTYADLSQEYWKNR